MSYFSIFGVLRHRKFGLNRKKDAQFFHITEDVHEPSEPDFVEDGPGVIARQHAFESGIEALNRTHCVVNSLADLRRTGFGIDLVPTGSWRQPKGIRGEIFVTFLGGLDALRFILEPLVCF